MRGGLSFDVPVRIGNGIDRNGLRRRRDTKQRSTLPKLLPAHPVRKEPVVAKPHESRREHVQEEAADELDGLESHRRPLALVGVVLPKELDLVAFESGQPVVADRHPVGVVRQVLQNLMRSAEKSP